MAITMAIKLALIAWYAMAGLLLLPLRLCKGTINCV